MQAVRQPISSRTSDPPLTTAPPANAVGQGSAPITASAPVSHTVPASVSAAVTLSWRVVTALELAAVIGSVLLALWLVAPLYAQTRWPVIVPSVLALWLVVYSQYVRGESWRALGLGGRHFGAALRLLALPCLLAAGACFLLGYRAQSLHRSTHFWSNVLLVPVWGIVQQFVLQAFVYRRVRALLVSESTSREVAARQLHWAIVATAALFAFVHLPNLMLTGLTFLLGLLLTWVYERAPNVLALGLAHGGLSLVLMHSLPEWLLHSLSVGYKHFLYQKF